jgi:hypothetical protein
MHCKSDSHQSVRSFNDLFYCTPTFRGIPKQFSVYILNICDESKLEFGYRGCVPSLPDIIEQIYSVANAYTLFLLPNP